MSGINVRPIEGRVQDVNNVIKLNELFVTGQAVGPNKRGMDSVTYGAYIVAADVAEAGSSDFVINATGHVAKAGDLIRIKTSTGSIVESEIGVLSVDTNTITLVGRVSSAFQAGDTFDICRYATIGLTSSGSFSAITSFTKNGSTVVVTEDTVTPANNIPLPVKLTGLSGDISITAQNLNVQTSHSGASPDSMQIGDGTTVWSITAVTGEGKVIDSGLNTKITNMALQLPASLGAKAMTASLSITVASDQTAIPMSAASLPLPTGAATELTLAAVDTKLGTLNTNVATQTTLASIDTKVATETTLAAMSAKLPASVGIKADAASLSVTLGTETRALLDELETEIKKVSACATGTELNVKLSNLNGAATEVTLDAINDKLPAALGPQTAAGSLAVIAATETVLAFGVIDFTSTSVSDVAYTQLIASIGAVIGRKIHIMVQGGEPMYLAIGGAGAEANAMIIPPGGYNGPIGLNIPATARLSLKAVNAATTINTGKLFYNIVG
jgi:hypothetical protein